MSVLLPTVARIAHKHVSLGVKPEQYPIIGNALLSAIQDVADLPDGHPALIAWGEAYGMLADVFINAEENLYQENENSPGGWRGFREFIIDDIKMESPNVKSFYLKPKDKGATPSFKGGQYVGTKVILENEKYEQIRQYSLSSFPKQGYLRITPKAEPRVLFLIIYIRPKSARVYCFKHQREPLILTVRPKIIFSSLQVSVLRP